MILFFHTKRGFNIMIPKKYLMLLIVLLLTGVTSQAFSFDIWEEGAKGLSDTSTSFNEYFDRYIKGHNAAGYGIVVDVVPARESGDTYNIYLDCVNNTKVRLFLTSHSGGLKDLKIGQKVSFSGEVLRWSRKIYETSRRPFIAITLGDCTIR
jgi:hypothetical protein